MYSLCVCVCVRERFIHAIFWQCLEIFLVVTTFGAGGDAGIYGWGPGMPINILALTRQLPHHHTQNVRPKGSTVPMVRKPVVGQAENFEFYSDTD